MHTQKSIHFSVHKDFYIRMGKLFCSSGKLGITEYNNLGTNFPLPKLKKMNWFFGVHIARKSDCLSWIVFSQSSFEDSYFIFEMGFLGSWQFFETSCEDAEIIFFCFSLSLLTGFIICTFFWNWFFLFCVVV